jgi:hypothetical protein
MERQTQITGVGGIYAVLAEVSSRPRYAFLVLQLVAEAADGRGQCRSLRCAGRWQARTPARLALHPAASHERTERPPRGAARARCIASLQAIELSGDEQRDAARIDLAVEEQVLAVGRANVSRAISDLVRAGLVTRHYAGYATNHRNRGGGRHAVYVVPPGVLRALGKTVATQSVAASSMRRQGELFAA